MKTLPILASLVAAASTLQAAPRISEFVADNLAGYQDDDGDYSDWIEIHNPDPGNLKLSGWYLTDDAEDLQKWVFPSNATIPENGYLVVHASGKNKATLFASTFHTNFSLAAGGEYLALVDPDGTIVHEFSEEYPNQYVDISYGTIGDNAGYFASPTPGEANGDFIGAPPKKVDFSFDGKTFFDSLEVTLSHEDPEVAIRYTLDGTEPTLSLFQPATLYDGPITIDATTTLRARAYKDGSLPGNVKSEVFIQLGEDMKDFESNLALCFLDSFGTRVDSLGKNNLYTTAAVFIDTDEGTGMAAPDGESDWAGRIGMRRRGQSSLDFAKKQYHFESWDEHDRDKSVSIFGMPAESDWIIHAPYADKTLMRNYLTYHWSRAMGHYAVRTKFMEVFYNPTDGEPVTYDDYRGVYVFMERIKRDGDRVDVEPLLPEHDSEPEITGGYIFRKDKEDQNNITIRTATERQTLQIIEPEYTITDKQKAWLTNYLNEMEEALHGDSFDDPEEGFRKYFNEANAIDNHILVEFTKNIDGYRLSNYIYKDRGGKMNFVAWDYNLSLGNANYLNGWIPEGWYYGLITRDQYPWYRDMFEDPEFALTYMDRWYELRRGMFATDALMTQIDDLTDHLRDAAGRNFVKWDRLGKYDWPNPDGYAQRQTYQSEVDFMKDWLAERVEWIDDQFEPPVKFNHQGGPLEPGTTLTMDNKISLFKPRPGKMYYTLDGSDPRLRGGEVNPEALLYEDGVPLTESGTVKARLLLNTGEWSALNEADFIVGELASSANLRITEIMYNPTDPSEDEIAAGFENNDDFEYLELLNTSDGPIQLYGAQFVDGVTFHFTDGILHTLGAGERALLVANLDAFTYRYGGGLPVVGAVQSGQLSNGGETLKLIGADGATIAEFAYDDDAEAGWAEEADGGGFALVLANESGSLNYGEPSMWTTGKEGGTPGTSETSDGHPTFNAFEITDIAVDNDGLEIHFTSQEGVDYEIQSSSNLQEFTPIQDVTASGSRTTVRLSRDVANTARYLRVATR